jgi:pimeloyl-ACP methyl ester carboxylesterase
MRPPQTRYVTVGNSEVAYQVLGAGPTTLVYHHGFCHLDLKWDVPPEAAFTERLASFSRLILFDRRGIGASERGPRGYVPTWEDWSEDLRAVLDAAGVESTAIFDLDVRHVLHLIRAPTLVLHNESPDRAAHARYLADRIAELG